MHVSIQNQGASEGVPSFGSNVWGTYRGFPHHNVVRNHVRSQVSCMVQKIDCNPRHLKDSNAGASRRSCLYYTAYVLFGFDVCSLRLLTFCYKEVRYYSARDSSINCSTQYYFVLCLSTCRTYSTKMSQQLKLGKTLLWRFLVLKSPL